MVVHIENVRITCKLPGSHLCELQLDRARGAIQSSSAGAECTAENGIGRATERMESQRSGLGPNERSRNIAVLTWRLDTNWIMSNQVGSCCCDLQLQFVHRHCVRPRNPQRIHHSDAGWIGIHHQHGFSLQKSPSRRKPLHCGIYSVTLSLIETGRTHWQIALSYHCDLTCLHGLFDKMFMCSSTIVLLRRWCSFNCRSFAPSSRHATSPSTQVQITCARKLF